MWLECKIPPPIVAVLIGACMWWASRFSFIAKVPFAVRIAMAATIGLIGLGISVMGAMAFRKARTTANPLRPETASTVVMSGIYRVTRNPMYVGLAVALIGWGAYLAAPLALLGPIVFMAFITRFQIIPEERALLAKFGDEFAAYIKKVKRWL